MRRLCCYSLFLPNEGRPDLLVQLATSVDSLRAYNREVAVALFVHGFVPPSFILQLQSMGVQVWFLEPYATRLSKLCPCGWRYLSQYPLLHKLLNFAEISSLRPDQVLLLDCDTYFQADVAVLFDRYDSADLVAREEVGACRSLLGPDPQMIDEDVLVRIGKDLGISPAPPFNLGVVLLNGGLWQRLAGLSPLLVNYAWRFMVWMAANRLEASSEFGEGAGIECVRQHWATLGPADRFLSLPYPSQNRWILDEVALWLTLGHLPETSFKDFDREDVVQNGEFQMDDRPPNWVVCHYFSQNLGLIQNWAQERASGKVVGLCP